MNKYEFDLLLAQDMDEAIANAEKRGVQSIKDKIKDCFLYKDLKRKGVFIIGRGLLDESALIQIIKENTGTDIDVLRRMINSTDSFDDKAAVGRILLNSGFGGDMVSRIISSRRAALRIADDILRAQDYTAAARRNILDNCGFDPGCLSEILKSNPQLTSEEVDDIIGRSVYDEEVLRVILTSHGFCAEKADRILRKRSIEENDILSLLDICYPCVVHFDNVQERASFKPDSYRELDFGISAGIKVCFSVNSAFKYLFDNLDWFSVEYSYMNGTFPVGADECFRLKMDGGTF